MEAPPRCRVAAERFPRIGRIGARSRFHIHDTDFDDVARLGAADVDRPGADMHTKAFAGAAAQQLAVDRPGATAVDAFFLLGPEVDAFKPGVAFDHALGIVAGVMDDRFDGDVVAGIDFKLRLQQLAEISPMHSVGVCRQVMVGRLAGRGLCRHRRRQCPGASPGRRRSAACEERTLEKAAPFAVEIVEKPLPMEFEFRAVRVIPTALSRTSLLFDVPDAFFL